MTDIEVPSKAVLDAETDQALAEFREARQQLAALGAQGAFYEDFSAAMAEQLLAQFAETPGLGRIVVSVAQTVKAFATEGAAAFGVDPDVDVLLTVLALAGEQIDREASHG